MDNHEKWARIQTDSAKKHIQYCKTMQIHYRNLRDFNNVNLWLDREHNAYCKLNQLRIKYWLPFV